MAVMPRDELKNWYRDAYPDDPAEQADAFIFLGYESAIQWHGELYNDAFEALYNPDIRDMLNGRGYEIRAFVRAYNRGIADKPQIIAGRAQIRPKLLGVLPGGLATL